MCMVSFDLIVNDLVGLLSPGIEGTGMWIATGKGFIWGEDYLKRIFFNWERCRGITDYRMEMMTLQTMRLKIHIASRKANVMKFFLIKFWI